MNENYSVSMTEDDLDALLKMYASNAFRVTAKGEVYGCNASGGFTLIPDVCALLFAPVREPVPEPDPNVPV